MIESTVITKPTLLEYLQSNLNIDCTVDPNFTLTYQQLIDIIKLVQTGQI